MTLEEVKKMLESRLTANDTRKGTKKALMVEMEFLQGYLAAHIVTDEDGKRSYSKECEGVPYMVICMMSGRSILD